MKTLFKSLNSLNNQYDDDDDDDGEPIGVNYKHYQIDKLHRKVVKNNKFSLLHLNIASLGTHKDEFEDVLSILDLNLDILGLTETRLIKDQSPIKHILMGMKSITYQLNPPMVALPYILITVSRVNSVKTWKINYIFLKNFNLLLLKFELMVKRILLLAAFTNTLIWILMNLIFSLNVAWKQ